MRRAWILLRTEALAWLRDPLPTLGGFMPTLIMLAAFGLLFGGRLAFNLAIVDHDAGDAGRLLRAAALEVPSPLDGLPYYKLIDVPEEQAWADFEKGRIQAVWVVPEDFSARIAAGDHPAFDMHFSNYNDDQAKNHRLYASEIRWRLYEKLDYPPPPVAWAEVYPREAMVAWFPIIAVGVALLAAMLGGMINMFMLTWRERQSGLTLQLSLAPRSLLWVLVPKTLLALIVALGTGTALLVIGSLFTGCWPRPAHWAAVELLMGLCALFWIGGALVAGLRVREFFAGMVLTILTGMTIFFLGGGLSLVRPNWEGTLLVAKLFPNLYLVDPLRDLVLFQQLPADWGRAMAYGCGFAALGIVAGFVLAARQLRRPG